MRELCIELMISTINSCWFCSVYPKGVIAALSALILAAWMHKEFFPRTEPYRQSYLYANCRSYLIMVLTELKLRKQIKENKEKLN